ncbi:hypothetical protein [Maridesulfovibrio sp. FT414]|uniref:hypothetical protein n=1 Tax=Maridesulfovibrio sp. FT414 TaxID=2979469 RepID=UPI003D8019F1
MGKSVSVGVWVKIRVFILFILGALFTVPGLLMVVAGFMEPDIKADDTLAMFFMGGLLLFCGLLIWWMMRKIYRTARRRAVYRGGSDHMAMGMGMAHAHYMTSMYDSEDSEVEDSGGESDSDFGDDGGYDSIDD